MSLQPLMLKEFVQAATPDTLHIVYNEGYWEARCHHAVLTKPSGSIEFSNLPELLSDLAGVGIRCSKIEWDGLPDLTYYPRDSAEVVNAHIKMMNEVLAQKNRENERAS